jgi:signal transduction histidine kinase/CheY-like chemotaxis protein
MSGPPRRREVRRLNLVWLSALALLLVGVLLGLRSETDHRRQQIRQTVVQADILAETVTAALAFDDHPTLRQYVEALSANPQIASAAIYDEAGRSVVRYVSAGAPQPPAQAQPPGARARAGIVRVARPVAETGAPLGSVYIETRREPLARIVGRHSALGLLLVMSFVLVAVATRAAAQLERRAEELRDAYGRLQFEVQERERAEEALRQSQKMEALGQLTGGVAHDFNNLLTVIMGGLETIGRYMPKLPDTPEGARIERARSMAMHGAERAATLTSRLLAFSRRQPLQPQALDANSLVREMSELLKRTLGETIALEVRLADGLWLAHADPGQLESAVLNLAVNARDAMPEGGTLTIETANAALEAAYVEQLPEGMRAGDYVMVAVRDSGVGMSSETLGRAFEPFFTTKDVGKGTGLGLSQVYGFARQSGGNVRILSELGAGTTVKLYLPRDLAGDAPVERIRAADPAALRGAEAVLVVEDHAELRVYSTSILRELGYQVHEAEDGASALQILDSDLPLDLLFTDVVLPGGMNGRQLADIARQARPELKVLFTTGYTRDAIVQNGSLEPGVQLITKPFSFDELAAKLRRVLDA